MAESLRDRQKQVAREAILHAAADEIVERGVTDFSLQAVAERAGVSTRTLYNYFENRDALITALLRWSDEATEALGGHLFPHEPAQIPQYIRDNYRAWTAQDNVLRALVQIDVLRSVEGKGRLPDLHDVARVTAVERDIVALRPDLAEDDARALAQLLRVIVSSRTWHRLCVEEGVAPQRAGAAAGWAYGVLRDALAEGAEPFADDPPAP